MYIIPAYSLQYNHYRLPVSNKPLNDVLTYTTTDLISFHQTAYLLP